MPMDEEYRKAMADAGEGRDGDGEGFEPLDDGYYLATLEKADESDRPGPSGFHQYVFVWKIKKPAAAKNRTQWDRISLSPKAAFKMRELFDATGYTYDSDPEELIGEEAVLEIEQAEITAGKRKGEMGNDVVKIHAADTDTLKLVAK